MAVISYWHDSLEPGDDLTPRPPLAGDTDVDVAIVGAGFSGLWTAYYLLQADPRLRVAVVERETAGFGASGRNGGWCLGDGSGPLRALSKEAGHDAVAAMIGEINAAVDEVGDVVEREHIDCGFAKGGALLLARTKQQLGRLRSRKKAHDRYGHKDAYTLLSASETSERINATRLVGGLFTPNAAALHPARLARGLACAVERLGGRVFEQTTVRSIDTGRVDTDCGVVKSPVVVRATEAYTASLEGQEREVLPLTNFMIATAPIADSVWSEIGLANRELFEDTILMLGYGQRTADGRIAWGGLGARYWYGSRVPPSPMHDARLAERLREGLVDLFPALEGVEVTHDWGGTLGISRDLRPGLGLDRDSGLAWVGGYFGAGVAASNAAGRTLADVIVGADTDRVRLPWVDHRSRRWEPEPVRWLGVQTAAAGAHAVDRIDRRRSR